MVSDRIRRRIELLLDEADQAVVAGDWPAVRAPAEKVLAFDPENAEAQASRIPSILRFPGGAGEVGGGREQVFRPSVVVRLEDWWR